MTALLIAAYRAQNGLSLIVRGMVVQEVGEEETDYGIRFFDYVAGIFERSGVEAPQAALGLHLLLQFVLVSAHSTVRHQLPADHRAYLKKKLPQLDSEQYRGINFILKDYLNLNAGAAFEIGLELISRLACQIEFRTELSGLKARLTEDAIPD